MGLFDKLKGLAPFIGPAVSVLGSVLGSRKQGEANEVAREGVDVARQDIAARQPFRDQLFASLQNQAQRPDLSNLFGSENPFATTLGPLNPQAPQATAPIQGPPPQFPGNLGGIRSRERINGQRTSMGGDDNLLPRRFEGFL